MVATLKKWVALVLMYAGAHRTSLGIIAWHMAKAAFSLAWSFAFIRLFHGDLLVHNGFPFITQDASIGIIYASGPIAALALSPLIDRDCSWLELSIVSSVHIWAIGLLTSIAISWVSRVIATAALLWVILGRIKNRRRSKDPAAGSKRRPRRGLATRNYAAFAYIPKTAAGLTLVFLLSLAAWDTPDILQADAPVGLDAAIREAKFTQLEGYEHVNDEWPRMGIEQKAKILKTVIEHDCSSWLGCPVPELAIEDLSPGNDLGSFNASTNVIAIDREHLDNSFPSVLETTLHECRHAYQHACRAMLLDLEEADPSYLRLEGIYEMALFLDAQDRFDTSDFAMKYRADDFLRYYCQPIEEDAREYAEFRSTQYYPEVFGYQAA
jgi:hypothetical protein